MFKYTFSLAVLICFGINQTHAREWVNNDKENITEYLIEYQEGPFFVLEIFTQPVDGFQDRTARFAFPAENQKNEKLHELLDDSGWHIMDTKSIKESDYTAYVPNEVQDTEIWKSENSWSEYWEGVYAEWITGNFDADFFENYNVRTDCADVAIALRWIFARIHKLPVGTRLAGSRVLITNESMRRTWASLPTAAQWHDDRRFRTALDWVLSNTYTHSLWDDSYPIKINAQTFRPGTVVLYLSGTMGHTRVVDQISGNIRLLASTIPREVRRLHGSPMSDRRWPSQESGSEYGVLKLRWPVKVGSRWKLLDQSRHPGYSLEQFTEAYQAEAPSHYQAILRRLQQIENPLESFRLLMVEVEQSVMARPEIVRNGFAYCQSADCSPGSSGYEQHSTPSRDGHLKENVKKIRDLKPAVETLPEGPEAIRDFDRLLDRSMNYDTGKNIQFETFVDRLFTEACPSTTATDPRQPIALRWCGTD